MSDLQISIQESLDNATPSDIINLPDEILNFPLIISKPCTVIGSEHTIVDVSESNETSAVYIEADNVVLSDFAVKNKNDSGYHGIHVKSKQSSLERLGVSCDIAIYIEDSSDIDIIEVNTFNAKKGIKIENSFNIELNACQIYDNTTGLDIIGESSVKGSIDSYQGFGINISATDVTPLTVGTEYQFILDGNLFFFTINQPTTYAELVDIINNLIGFQPTYEAKIEGNDIIITTKNENILIEAGSATQSFLSTIGASPQTPVNGREYSIAKFGLSIHEDDISVITKNTLYTFYVDSNEIQFYSPETDGTTYRELVDVISPRLPSEYEIDIVDGDIQIKTETPSTIVTAGDRFKDLFTELGIDPPSSLYILESFQKLGISINPSDASPFMDDIYSLIVNGIEYSFEFTTANPTYQEVVDIMNLNTNFSSTQTAVIDNGDIKIIAKENSIEIEDIKSNLFTELSAPILPPVSGSEGARLDRSYNINILNCAIYQNQIGVRIINSNDITFTAETKVYSNTNIGIWQMPSSYNVNFRGEIYDNKNYGYRNTDKQGGPHEADVRETWWGDITGPSMFASGEGDKISSGVLWQPQRQNGTVVDLSYPRTREFILSALGYPVVKVELTDEQIQLCIDKAIDRYMKFRTPEPVQRYISIKAGSSMVELPLDMPKEEIIEVTYTPNADIFSQLSGSGESFYLTYYLQNTGGTFLSDFYVAMAYKETMETVLGIRPTYEFLSGPNEKGEYVDFIRLSPRPDAGVVLGVLFSRPMTEAEIDSKEWIHKYALSWAKEFLGRIRSKFGSVPGPTGEMQLDGQTLLAEAQQERQQLDESILSRSEPFGFSVG